MDTDIILEEVLITPASSVVRNPSPDPSDNHEIDSPPEDIDTDFESALKTHGCAEDVKQCLIRGSKANYINPVSNKAAINFATESCDPAIISVLLRHSVVKVDHENDNLTPLNSLAQKITPENFADVTECMRLLLQYGASPNGYEGLLRDRITPLHQVLCHSELNKEQKREIVLLLLEFDMSLEAIYYSAPVCNRKFRYDHYYVLVPDLIKKFYPDLIITDVELEEVCLEVDDLNEDDDDELEEMLEEAFDVQDLNQFRLVMDKGLDPMQTCFYKEKLIIPFEKVLHDGLPEFLEECLRRGCKADYINYDLDKAAINFVADSCDPRVFKMLLHHPGVQVNHLFKQLSPLHSLAKSISNENALAVTTCMKLLLDNGATPNVTGKHQWTPLHYVLIQSKINAESKREVVQLLLDPRYDVDVDSYSYGQLRSILEHDYQDLALPAVPPKVLYKTLLEYLHSGDERSFLHEIPWYREQLTPDQNIELLCEAVKFGRHEALTVLLQKKFESLEQSPIEDAIVVGNWMALKKLLKYGFLIKAPSKLLDLCTNHVLQGKKASIENCDFKRCYQVMLDSKQFSVNEIDYSNSKVINSNFLMKEQFYHGVYLGLDIQYYSVIFLKEAFDNCINTKRGEEYNQIHMNFKYFVPNEQQKQKGDNDMTTISSIANSEEHHHLLTHPLIQSFLFLKWHRFSFFFYLNSLFFLIFAASIINDTSLSFNENKHLVSTLLVWIGIVYLIVREVLQFIMSPMKKEYILSPRNWVDLALICLSIFNCFGTSFDENTRRGIATSVIILIAMELCLLLVSLPSLFISTLSMILRAVFFTFLKIISFFLIFIFAFSFCFQILLSNPDINCSSPDSQTLKSDFNKFPNFFISFIKTMVMFTGEFDAGAICFNLSYGYVVFLLFVFFMAIMVLNLLNGLVIADIQKIINQAELNGLIWRANLLHHFEILLNRYEILLIVMCGRSPLNNVLRNISEKILNQCPNYTAHREIIISQNFDFKNRIIFDTINFEWVRRFRNERKTQKMYLGPNRQYFPKWYVREVYEMDNRIVTLSKNIIKQKKLAHKKSVRQRRNEVIKERRWKDIQKQLKDNRKQVKDIQEKLSKLI